MKTLTQILYIIHILISGGMLLMPQLRADTPTEEAGQ